MFSFEEFCQFLSHRGHYSWFYMDKELLPKLEQMELDLVHIEPTNDPSIVRVWYPKSRFTDRPIDKEELKRMLMAAIEASDWEQIKKIKERMK